MMILNMSKFKGGHGVKALIAELLGGEIARFKVGYSRISICKS
jgi:hypothetical protein